MKLLWWFCLWHPWWVDCSFCSGTSNNSVLLNVARQIQHSSEMGSALFNFLIPFSKQNYRPHDSSCRLFCCAFILKYWAGCTVLQTRRFDSMELRVAWMRCCGSYALSGHTHIETHTHTHTQLRRLTSFVLAVLLGLFLLPADHLPLTLLTGPGCRLTVCAEREL